MPFIFSERLPVPTLKSYGCISLLIFIVSAVYWRRGLPELSSLNSESTTTATNHNQDENYHDESDDFLDKVISQPFLLWVISYVLLPFYCVLPANKQLKLHS